jgi:glycosyltransferase involved in cell wall biosynthesis
MDIHFDNVNLSSNNGPNSFAGKLAKYIVASGNSLTSLQDADVSLTFIETHRLWFSKKPFAQRLDGIYFNTRQDYRTQNSNIKKTHDRASGVVYQTQFNKELITRYFGEHKNSVIINNGADLETINSTQPLKSEVFDKYDKVWCCASNWRPHKRLNDNIEYFLQHAGANDLMLVGGDVSDLNVIRDQRVKYLGSLQQNQLFSIYKACDNFIHLAWLDHCPNVVVDARACGCKIICSSAGGTKEIAGKDATIVEEEEWNFEPVDLYSPPKLDFSAKVVNNSNSELDMKMVSKQYEKFLENLL